MPVAYVCRSCKGPPLPKPPDGECPNCGGFYSHNRVHVRDGDVDGAERAPIEDGVAMSMDDAMSQITDDDTKRVATGMDGVDWVLGENARGDRGFPRPVAFLLAAQKGGGKTTLVIELFKRLGNLGYTCLLVQTEESVKQLAVRYQRMGPYPSKFLVVQQSDFSNIVQLMEEHKPDYACIDSLGSVEGVISPSGEEYAVGTAQAVNTAARELKKFSDAVGITLLCVGHVTKPGEVAGSNAVQHMLDGTFYLRYFDARKKAKDMRRVFEADAKNRFARVDRQALLEMRDEGMKDHGPYKKPDEDEDEDNEAKAPTERSKPRADPDPQPRAEPRAEPRTEPRAEPRTEPRAEPRARKESATVAREVLAPTPTPTPIRAATVAPPATVVPGALCDGEDCDKPATCFGQYDDDEVPSFSCDGCCDHSQRGGKCSPVVAGESSLAPQGVQAVQKADKPGWMKPLPPEQRAVQAMMMRRESGNPTLLPRRKTR